MSHDRDHETLRDHQGTTSVDSDIAAPGRASKSAELRRTSSPTPSGILMRKASGDVGANSEQAVAHASGSGGGALPDELRSKFESSLGVDLSGVRVHTGSESAQAASAVGAHAYAMGNDIHFAAGQYDPGSERGQHLIAHEVAHTVQQRGAPATRQNKLEVSSPGDTAEIEADNAAAAMVAGRPATIASMPSSGILHRQAAPPADAPVSARDGKPSGAVGAKVTNKSTDIMLSGTYPIPYKNKYVNGSISMTLKGSGTLNYPSVTPEGVDGEVSVGADTKEGHKAGGEGTVISAEKIALYTKGATEKAQQEAQTKVEEMMEIQSVELEPLSIKSAAEATKGNDSTKKASIGGDVSASVTVKFAKRPPVTIVGTLVGLKFEGGMPTFSGPGITTTFPIGEFPLEHDYGGGYSVKASVGASCTLTAKLNWTDELAKRATQKAVEKFAQKGAEKVAETAETAAATAPEAAVTAALDAAAIAEIAGFGAIAVSMGAALVIGSNQVMEIKEYEARGRRAIDSYVAGAMAALGVPSANPGGDATYFVQGQGAYAARKNQMMAAVKAKLPAGHNLGDAEIMARVQQEIQQNADQLRQSVDNMARPAFAKVFAEAYYRDQQSWIFKTEDRRDAERVATRLGQADVRVGEDGVAYQVDKDGNRIDGDRIND